MRLSVTVAALCAVSSPGLAAEQADDGWNISGQVGGGVGLVRDYDGGGDTRTVPVIVLEAEASTRFGTFALGRQGLSWMPITGEKLQAGVFATYDSGRKDDDNSAFESGSEYLRGMGEIEGTPEGGAFIKYQLGRVGASLSARHALGTEGHDGAIVDLGGSVMLYQQPKFQIKAETTLSWVDEKYMQTYYGVTREQAARTRFPVYQIDAGFNAAQFGLTGIYSFAPRWSLVGIASYRKLLGDAADSPIVQKDGYPEFALLVTRAWGKAD